MKITFIGGGNMATALIGGLLKQGFPASDLRVVEINPDHCARLQQQFGVQADAALASGIAAQDVIVLAVKPQQLQQLGASLAPLLQQQLVISIAAGVRVQDLARWLHTRCLVRAMPNTPALIQQGVSGLFAASEVTASQRATAERILGAVGQTLWLDEEGQLDAVTAISGSGPAYVFYFMEALQAAGEALGLSADQAQTLATATFVGASALASQSGESVSELRARVTSKNGTTERALLTMEKDQLKQSIMRAAAAAALRAKSLGDELGGDRPC